MKKKINDLAIFGGLPEFEEKLHVGRPNIGSKKRLSNYLSEVIDQKWLTNNGVFVQKLEQKVAEFIKVKNCILVCNATIGLEVLARALDWTGEVIIPSFTFVATAHALQWLGITPVFCDIDSRTHNLNPHEVEKLISKRTTGILGVHIWGRPCAIPELTNIAEKHGLNLAFDAAHAFGCSYQGEMLGTFGEAEVFSFHATKFYNTFEGGAILTNNDELAAKLRSMINFGFQGYDNVVRLGINGKMTEAAAVMGLTNFVNINRFIDKNYKNYKIYSKELHDIPGLELIYFDKSENNNYQYIVIEIDGIDSILSRDQINDILHAENVLSRRYFYPGCHKMEPYRTLYPLVNSRLNHTNTLTKRTLLLPTGTAITENDIRKICQIIRFSIVFGHEINNYLNTKTR